MLKIFHLRIDTKDTLQRVYHYVQKSRQFTMLKIIFLIFISHAMSNVR